MMGMVDLRDDGSWSTVNQILAPPSASWKRSRVAPASESQSGEKYGNCIFVVEEFPVPRCHGQMRLQVTAAGTARWRCVQCNSSVAWKAYRRSHSLTGESFVPLCAGQAEEPTGSSSASASGPVVNVQVEGATLIVPSSDVPAAVTQPERSASAATRWLRCPTRSRVSQPVPLARQIEQPLQSGPTQRQVDYIAQIALRRGFQPDEVLGQITTRAQASSWIDQHR